MRTVATVLLLGGAVGGALAQIVDFEAYNDLQTDVMFRAPNVSGSTSAFLVTPANGGPNVAQITASAPANSLTPASTRSFMSQWQFISTATSNWLRLTTSNTATLGNPLINLNQTLSLDIYSTVAVQVAIGVRETAAGGGPSGAVWSNGGSLGGIEFVSNGGLNASGAPGGQLVAANTWTRITYNFAALSANNPGSVNVRGFAGTTANSVIDGTYGVLEHIAFTSVGQAGPYTAYVDNLNVAPVPEPASLAALGLGAMALLRRRRSR